MHSDTPPLAEGEKLHLRVRVEGGSWSVITLPDNAYVASGASLTEVQPALPARAIPAGGTAAPDIASAGGSLTQITLRWDLAPKATRPTGYELDFVVGDDDADTDTVQANWESVLPESRSGYARSPVSHRGLKAGTEYVYRIFPYKDGVYGPPEVATATTAPAVAPDTRLNLRVVAEGPTKLKLTWNAPRTTGGSAVTGYFIQVGNDVDDNRTFTVAAARPWVSVNDVTEVANSSDALALDIAQTPWEVDDTSTREYIYTGLNPDDARWFRVIALSGVASVTLSVDASEPDGANPEAMDALGSAVPVRGQTARASVPSAPNGLVAEQARNSNLTGTTDRGVLLLWNAPEDPKGAALDGYTIARKVDDGEWDDEWKEIKESDPRTYLTDEEIPGATEVRYYRVAAFNSAGTGAWTAAVRYPADTSHIVPPPLMAPTITSVTPGTGTVMVEWTPGANAIGHLVLLFQSDFSGTPMVGTPSGNSHMFSDVPAESYIAVVVSYRSAMDYEYDPSDVVTVQ